MAIQSETKRLLAAICADDGADVLASKRELWRVVRLAGRPGGQADMSQVVAELNSALPRNLPSAVCREVLWMLSEIGGDESVAPVSELLKRRELRDDARMALERIPGDASLAALEAGLAAVSDDFKINIAQSLRRRGVKVPGHPCQKLLPTKETTVKAIE